MIERTLFRPYRVNMIYDKTGCGKWQHMHRETLQGAQSDITWMSEHVELAFCSITRDPDDCSEPALLYWDSPMETLQ